MSRVTDLSKLSMGDDNRLTAPGGLRRLVFSCCQVQVKVLSGLPLTVSTEYVKVDSFLMVDFKEAENESRHLGKAL